MSSYPRKDAEARTGSNVPGEPLLAQNRAELGKAAKVHKKLGLERPRPSSKLLSKADRRVTASIASEVANEWRRASVEVEGDSARISALKIAARRKLDRRLARELPNYTKARALQRAELREHHKASATAFTSMADSRAHVAWGDVGATLTDASDFVPPFTSFDVQSDPNRFIVRDDSFAKPEIGHLVNNIDYDQDDDTHAVAANWAACGVAFTTPKDGRLEIAAVLRNFYNKVMFSVTDDFGFSSADMDISLQLFIVVVRGTKAIWLPTLLRHTGLVSHGSDLSFSESDIDDTRPFTITATTDERFNANESFLVLAGSKVLIDCDLDDMHGRIDAVLWWQLQKLSIGIADDIIT